MKIAHGLQISGSCSLVYAIHCMGVGVGLKSLPSATKELAGSYGQLGNEERLGAARQSVWVKVD